MAHAWAVPTDRSTAISVATARTPTADCARTDAPIATVVPVAVTVGVTVDVGRRVAVTVAETVGLGVGVTVTVTVDRGVAVAVPDGVDASPGVTDRVADGTTAPANGVGEATAPGATTVPSEGVPVVDGVSDAGAVAADP